MGTGSRQKEDAMNDRFPPPFVVGQKYLDRQGEYTVTAANEQKVTIERPDGRSTIEDAIFKARIYRNIVMERGGDPGSSRAFRDVNRREPAERREVLMERILQLEEDGADHTGVEIDRLLANVARDLGYSADEISELHTTGRGVLANHGDWAKATMTMEQFHQKVGTTVYVDGGSRRQCNVYRITRKGLDELRRRR